MSDENASQQEPTSNEERGSRSGSPSCYPPSRSTVAARRVLLEQSWGDPVEFDLPDGFKLAKGACRQGDVYLNAAKFFRTGEVEWRPVEPELWDRPTREIYCGADWYTLLIRPIEDRDRAGR